MNHLTIKSAQDLVTSREETRAGFVSLALEKNYLAGPYIEEAKALKALANRAKKPNDLLKIEDVRMGLLTAAGLSDKSLNHLTEEDKTLAIKGLIETFLEPAGKKFIDELIYRYLLIKGDALGGKARNLAGVLGERKFLRTLISVLNLSGVDFQWLDAKTKTWLAKSKADADIEKNLKGLCWSKTNTPRIMLLNKTIPLVRKNVDLILLEGTEECLDDPKHRIIKEDKKYLALGELKGGIDPAGADEHWKTANSALNRIRTSFKKKRLKPYTFFVGAAIENSMATEIFKQLKGNVLQNAGNLTDDDQLTGICKWLIDL